MNEAGLKGWLLRGMASLPIIQRELRGASRRLATRRVRFWTAAIAIGASLFTIASRTAAPGPGTFANPLFAVQTACAFGLALLAGVFLTSDSLSEERREGTFGLLLLTDLTSHDIIMGKFAATALNAFYCLLAVLPVTAVPLLQGGITLGEFGRTVFALANAMFFSLAAGLLVSALVIDYTRALIGALALVAVIAAGLPALAEVGSVIGISSGWFAFTLASPFYSYVYAAEPVYAEEPGSFWIALFASQILGWSLLGLADLALARLWPGGSYWNERMFARKLEQTVGATQPRRRRKKAFDPIVSLTGPVTALRFLVWVIVCLWAAVVCNGRLWPSQPLLEHPGAKPFAFLLKSLVAFQACRFFVETRRSGALELLLCSPLRNRDLLRAQWRALRRIFLWPLVVFLLLQVVAISSPLPTVPIGRGILPGATELQMETSFLSVFFLTLSLFADILAAGWFGMWLALTIKRPVLAPAMTILFVLILPSCLYRLDLVVDMLFISWSTAQLTRDFRWVVLSSVEPILPLSLEEPKPA